RGSSVAVSQSPFLQSPFLQSPFLQSPLPLSNRVPAHRLHEVHSRVLTARRDRDRLVAVEDSAEYGAVAPSRGDLRFDRADGFLEISDLCTERGHRVAYRAAMCIEHSRRLQGERRAQAL